MIRTRNLGNGRIVQYDTTKGKVIYRGPAKDYPVSPDSGIALTSEALSRTNDFNFKLRYWL